ncbi:MAG: chorismate mutase [Bacillota bacterium]|nr:chorismate mutase [Bacillota bacterium]
MTIDALRMEIDTLDSRIAELITRRLMCAREIGAIKKAENVPLANIDREIAVIDHVRAVASTVIDDEEIGEAVEKIYFSIITMSRRMQ